MRSLPPPALGECRHCGLTTLSIAVRGRPILVVPERQCPHPRRSHGRGVGSEDAADNCPIRRHVKIVGIPLPGGARVPGTFEDEPHPGTSEKSLALFLLVVARLDLLLLLHGGLLRRRPRER